MTTQMTGCISRMNTMLPDKVSDGLSATSKINHRKSDVIRNIGYPSYQGIRQKGMVLLADQHSYLISRGDDLLEQLTSLDQNNLHIKHPVYIQAYSDNTVIIRLDFSYQLTPNQQSSQQGSASGLNVQQQNLLSQLCKPSTTEPYGNCHLDLQGGMYQAVSQQDITCTSLNCSSYHLQQGLPVQIDYLQAKRSKNQTEIGVIPISVVVDAITLPLQILLIGKAFEGL